MGVGGGRRGDIKKKEKECPRSVLEREKERKKWKERESRGGKAGREGEGERRGERGGESAEAGVN